MDTIYNQIKALKAQGLTMKQIADKLNSENLKTSSGVKWSVGSIANFYYYHSRRLAKNSGKLRSSETTPDVFSEVLHSNLKDTTKIACIKALHASGRR